MSRRILAAALLAALPVALSGCPFILPFDSLGEQDGGASGSDAAGSSRDAQIAQADAQAEPVVDGAVPQADGSQVEGDASATGLDAGQGSQDAQVLPGADAATPTGLDASEQPQADAAAPTGLDAAQPLGLDAAQPAGLDAAIVQPGFDAAQPAGLDAAQPVGLDAAQPVGLDAAQPAGLDAAQPVGLDAAQPAGLDAAQPAGLDAAQPAGLDAAQPAGLDAAQPGSYSISGTVSGALAANIVLSLSSGATATTDSAGDYTFAGVSPGAYSITPANVEGYALYPGNVIVTVTNANLMGVNFIARVLEASCQGQFASSWATVDDFVLAAGYSSAADSVAADSFGNVYASGYGNDSTGNSHWLVRKSSNGGASWTTFDTTELYEAPALIAVANGVAYAAAAQPDWVTSQLRRSTDFFANAIKSFSGSTNGPGTMAVSPFSQDLFVTWLIGGGRQLYALSDPTGSWTGLTTPPSITNNVTFDATGRVYEVGYNGSGWWVNRCADVPCNSASTWTQVDTSAGLGGGAVVSGSTLAPNGTLYISGWSGTPTWVIRKTPDNGTTWVTDLSLSGFPQSWGASMISEGTGNIFAAGKAHDAASHSHWLIQTLKPGASSWVLSDDYQLDSAHDSGFGSPAALAVDSSGSIYASGAAQDAAGKTHWITRKLLCGGGEDWLPSGGGGQAQSIAIDPTTNDIYVAGVTTSSPNGIVRRSQDNGLTWSIFQDFTSAGYQITSKLRSDKAGDLFVAGNTTGSPADSVIAWKGPGAASFQNVDDNSGANSVGHGVTVDSQGNVFVVATSNSTSGIVRKSTYSGSTFSAWTVEETYAPGSWVQPDAMFVDPSDYVYWTGYYSLYTWVVHVSPPGGTNWSKAEDYGNPYAVARAGGAAPNGTVYVVGDYNVSNNRQWKVRKSPDKGATWSEADSFQLTASSANNMPLGVAFGGGKIFVVGVGDAGGGILRWVVRSSPDGTTWTTVDNWAMAPGKNAYSEDVAVDSSGRVFMVGSAIDASGQQHWVVRQLQ